MSDEGAEASPPRLLNGSISNSVNKNVPKPEFTARAVLLGLLVGCLIAFTNLYLGLQSGWISVMSIQSALLGRLLGLFLTQYNPRNPFTAKENVVLQTTAVATGTMPLAAGFVGIIPALGLLEEAKDGHGPIQFNWLKGILWSSGIVFFGVFLAVPLRKQTVIKEKLAFPSGTATAQLISVLYKQPLRVDAPPGPPPREQSNLAEDTERLLQPDEDLHNDNDADGREDERVAENEEIANKRVGERKNGWTPLIWSFAAAAGVTILAYFFPVVFSIPLFGVYLAREWLWYFTPSLSYVGQGIIMGFPTTVSMNLGMFVGWAILSPICSHFGWAPGSAGDMSTGARGWILWVALAIMTVDSLISLLPVVGEFLDQMIHAFGGRSSRSISTTGTTASDEVEPPSRLVPTKWVVWGLCFSIVSGTLIVWFVFGSEGIKPWATILAFALGGGMSLLGVRALGETDLNPVSGLGKISQLFFAILQPGNVVANIIAGGVAEAGAQQAGDLMQDFKTGHLVGASPRAQFQGQVIGSLVSVFVTTTAFTLYSRAYPIPGPNFPAPTAYVWLNLARLLRSSSLPPHVDQFMIAFGVFAGFLALIKVWALKHRGAWVKWIPSGVAFAIGMLNTPNFSMTRLVGGMIEFAWRRRESARRHRLRLEGEDDGDDSDGETPAESRRDEMGDIAIIIVASGFVLGEGVGSIVNLILRMLGVEQTSCWGCVKGVCGTCP
ncbi:hypothetical protein M408DRAFT_22638 [Serendipita vermifera MAFF 305830]|uniref:OPT superfamily oligopeptide transporter n=1 Tax=Serendipita vermifera MAFF 305830 TaxID=933852 RepID=A0A0C3BE75_SERVB|nr:hypothetical protein M408DRAFT_22638 [Serendipita vermifera MAFF 305830]